MKKTYTIHSIEELAPVVKELIIMTETQPIWAFAGNMGAGKTTLIKALCIALGVAPNEINSPTFAIVNEYQANKPSKTIYHFDFYRIESETEAFDLGYEEYFYSNDLCFIEWPQKIASLMPNPSGIVRIEVLEGNTRLITISVE